MTYEKRRFLGKYRGVVTDNSDPDSQGRVKASVPEVLVDQDLGWALPCSPYAGSGVGFFFVPPVGANVWIEFEDGNTDRPIWSGCFWAQGEAPSQTSGKGGDVKVIKTDYANITIDDVSQSLTIETTDGLKMVMDSSGIELSNGASSVKLDPSTVNVNDGALEVT